MGLPPDGLRASLVPGDKLWVVGFLDAVIEVSGNLNDGYLTDFACSDASVQCRAWMADFAGNPAGTWVV